MGSVEVKSSIVALVGSKNNAGDYLIKYRAKKLFDKYRPDINVIEKSAWEELSESDLQDVNSSSALLLLGGPAVQPNIYPQVYKLTKDLNDIKVPIVTMGVGLKSGNLEWGSSRTFQFSKESKALLDRVMESGVTSSVRDYYALNALARNGYDNFIVTGCPAYFTDTKVGEYPKDVGDIKKISLSLGVGFLRSKKLLNQMKRLVLSVRNKFEGAELTAVFHHSLSSEFLKTHNATDSFLRAHKEFARWLESESISYVDVSRSAEKMIEHYEGSDLHVGYRVHAHILMTSMAKPTFLISEDSRGMGVASVLLGNVVPAFDSSNDSVLFRGLRKVGVDVGYRGVDQKLHDEVIGMIAYELRTSFIKSRQADAQVEYYRDIMRDFICGLPS